MMIPISKRFRRLLPVLVALVTGFGVSAKPPEIRQSVLNDGKAVNAASVPSIPGVPIPGLREGGVPQGIEYLPARKRLLISHYFENGASRISVLDSTSGKLLASPMLVDPSGDTHRGHLGGIAVMGKSLFAASDGYVYQYKLRPFLSDDPAARVRAVSRRKGETNASFCTASKEWLFVGEFGYGKKYPTDPSHHMKDRRGVGKYAWVCGYKRADPMGRPECVLSIQQKVQGMCVSGKRIYLSVSYGRANRSQIVVYRNPMHEPAHRKVSVRGGKSVPLWFLDKENFIGKIDFPPMAEGIVMMGGRLAVLSESGAKKYLAGGKGPLERVLMLDVSEFQSK